jgi:tetratricopeptide (TPR) repeat protein
MSDRPLLSMVLIARDEAENIEPCFSSWWDHVDEVVLCDTGSQDDTIKRARVFAAERGELHKLIITEYEWHDDFAAARNHADSCATGRWMCWADLDDVVEGAELLRQLAAAAPSDVNAFMFDYEYARDQHGNVICTLKRERLIRADTPGRTWLGRVHEAQTLEGQVTLVGAEQAVWRHRKQPDPERVSTRNLDILEQWVLDEPENGRVLQYLGTERAANGKHAEAIDAYRRYLELDGEPAEYRAQCRRKLACSLIALAQPQAAFAAGVEAAGENPDWPDCWLTLAQASYLLGRHESAIQFAEQVLRRGMPESLLILNPLDYTVEPRVVIAGSLQALGRLDEAIGIAEEVLAKVPGHYLIAPAYGEWLSQRKREQTARTWLSCVELLCAHDEQAKALALLEETCPYFIQDAPAIVAARSQLRERLLFARRPALYAEHYTSGGSKKEDMVDDEKVTELCEALPRVQFLARTIREIREAA